jgi:hypothetical protein
MDRRRRRFENLERRGEELPVAEIHSRRLEPRERAKGEHLDGTRLVAGRRGGDQRHAAISAGWL